MSVRVGVMQRPLGGESDFLRTTIAQAGYDVVPMTDESGDPSKVDIVWVQGNVNWYPLLRKGLGRLRNGRRPTVLVWHTEPLPFPGDCEFSGPRLTIREVAKILLRDKRATDAYTNSRRLRQMHERGLLDVCVVSSRTRQEYLATVGISSHFVPLGFYEGMGRDLNRERDIDVLFLGAMDVARHLRVVRKLRSRGVNLHAAGSWKGGDTWGEGRIQLINRARIFVNIQRHRGQYSGHRFGLGMGNRSMVLSEPVHDPFPYEPGVHYVSCDLTEMPETIRSYLANDRARKAIADAGHEFVTQRLTMKESIATILPVMAEIHARRGSG